MPMPSSVMLMTFCGRPLTVAAVAARLLDAGQEHDRAHRVARASGSFVSCSVSIVFCTVVLWCGWLGVRLHLDGFREGAHL
jgi:hypothetical protein